MAGQAHLEELALPCRGCPPPAAGGMPAAATTTKARRRANACIPVLRFLPPVLPSRAIGGSAKCIIITECRRIQSAGQRNLKSPCPRSPMPTADPAILARREEIVARARRRSSAPTHVIVRRGRAPRLRDRRAHRLSRPCRSPSSCPARPRRSRRSWPSSARPASRSCPRRRHVALRRRAALARRGRRRPRPHEPHPRHRLRQPHRPGSRPASPTSTSPTPSATAASSTPPTRRASSPAPSPATSP